MGVLRNAYKISIGRHEGDGDRLKDVGENNIEMDLKQLWLIDLERINLTQDEDHWRSLVVTVVTFWII
jgi:hypothetical protein